MTNKKHILVFLSLEPDYMRLLEMIATTKCDKTTQDDNLPTTRMARKGEVMMIRYSRGRQRKVVDGLGGIKGNSKIHALIALIINNDVMARWGAGIRHARHGQNSV